MPYCGPWCESCNPDGWRDPQSRALGWMVAERELDRARDPFHERARLHGFQRDPSVKANSPGSNPDGADPYTVDADYTARCPNCHSLVDPGRYCDQCGEVLSVALAKGTQFSGGVDLTVSDGEGREQQPGPGDDVPCPSCGWMNKGDAIFCRDCGRGITSSAFAAELNGANPPVSDKTTSSSGRDYDEPRRRDADWGSSDAERMRETAERISRHDRQGQTLPQRVDAIAHLLDAAAIDLDHASKVYYAARGDWQERTGLDPDLAENDAIISRRTQSDPDTRHAWAVLRRAEQKWKTALRAYDGISARQSHMLGDTDEYSLRTGPSGLAPIDRARQPAGVSPIDRAREPRHLDGDLRPIDTSQQRSRTGVRPIDRSRQ